MRRLCLAVCGLAVALAVCLVPAISVFGQEGATQSAPEGGGISVMVTKAKDMAAQAEADIRAKRIAVLEKLEAGDVSVEEALGMLDAIPVPSARYKAGGPGSWFKLEIAKGQESVMAMVPSSIVRWTIVEGPKMAKQAIDNMPAEQQGGIPPEAKKFLDMDLSGFVTIVDAFADVSQETKIFHVSEGDETVMVTVVPKP